MRSSERVVERSSGRRELQLLDRAFAVLELFDGDHPDWSATEAARAVGLPVPTAHRILLGLMRASYLSRDHDSKRFSLGPAALTFAKRANAALDLPRLAQPVLRQLTALTNETALMTMLNDRRDRVCCSARVEPSQPLQLSVAPGNELPLHAGAMQKVLLAYLPAPEINSVLSGELPALSRATITDPVRLRSNLETVRSRGWAISFEETNEEVWGVAVPLIDAGGSPTAALGLASSRESLSVPAVQRHLVDLHAAARTLADRFGYSLPSLKLPAQRDLAAA
jgi:DNA-binding IclR family transcriptional regulator